jgi:selenoprotein W-related protein
MQLAFAQRLDGAGTPANLQRGHCRELTLIPSTGGQFEILVNDELVWERKRDGGFPGPKELKQKIREVIDPERDLGHIDRKKHEGLDS